MYHGKFKGRPQLGVVKPELKYHSGQLKKLDVFYKQPYEILKRSFPSFMFLDLYSKTRSDRPTVQQNILNNYHPRVTYQSKYVALLALFFAGNFIWLWTYKTRVIEDEWKRKYGTEYPMFKQIRLAVWARAYSVYYLHLFKYKIYFFQDEQQIDPTNNDSLQQEAFQVYQFKRLLREQRYRKKRDDSFDFLDLGQTDVDLFDDFT